MNRKIQEALKLASTDPSAAYDKLAGRGMISQGTIRSMLSREFESTDRDFDSGEATDADATFTLKQFLDDNAGTVDAEDIVAMCALDVGESYAMGGGAFARTLTTRIR